MDNITFSAPKWALILPIILMLVDIVLGFSDALIKKNLKSSVMTAGLFKKFGELCLIILSMIICVAISIPFGFCYTVSSYICLTEFVSIMNILKQYGISIPKEITNKIKVGDKDV